jgi:sugar phosphate isomerase/epimerase
MKLSLFSVSYAGYWGQQALDLSQFIAKAAELGYPGVMLAGKRPHLSPLDMNADRLAMISDQLTQHRLECTVIAGYTDFASTAAAEVPYMEMQIQYVESLARMASALGCSIVRIFTAYDLEGSNTRLTWNTVVKSLQEICDRAAAHGVTIAVQNHHDLAVNTDSLLDLFQEIDRPNCKAGFDAWSPALRGEDLYKAARKLAPQTVITTNADYVKIPRFRYEPALVNYARLEPDLVQAVKFGEGFIDYQSFFQGLKDGGFDGIAHYEMCSPVRGGGAMKNLDAYAGHYLRWMRDHLGIGEGPRKTA